MLLGSFTLCQAYLVGALASLYEPEAVFQATFATTFSTVGLSYYAWTTKRDFTSFRGYMTVFLSALLMTFISLFFFGTGVDIALLSFAAVLIFGSYIVYDTQLILGNKTYEINDEDYVIGALVLYVDIVVLFVRILKIIGKKKSD